MLIPYWLTVGSTALPSSICGLKFYSCTTQTTKCYDFITVVLTMQNLCEVICTAIFVQHF